MDALFRRCIIRRTRYKYTQLNKPDPGHIRQIAYRMIAQLLFNHARDKFPQGVRIYGQFLPFLNEYIAVLNIEQDSPVFCLCHPAAENAVHHHRIQGA